MQRRDFLTIPGLAASAAPARTGLPQYRIHSAHQAAANPGMPGPWPGRVVNVHAPAAIRPSDDFVDRTVVAEMMRRGMLLLTGEKDTVSAWRRFVGPSDVVGIKLNCSGAPKICSHPVVVGEVVKQLIASGVKPGNITLYERFQDQLDTVPYAKYVPDGVRTFAASTFRDSINAYDPRTYVEVDFFGEDDTRSNLIRLVSERFTKIINVPNMKDHGASGVTGCLKNIAYGSFHNVARSHRFEKTNTYSFIGTLASVEPLRSRTVLQVMDGLKGVWHGGPFANWPQYQFHPSRILFGTDPVAMDHLLLDFIEAERKRRGAISVWDHERKNLTRGDMRATANLNNFLREPGHIEYAGTLGLGVYESARIDERKVSI
jgi:uncharacterized protein (DUF362 family)